MKKSCNCIMKFTLYETLLNYPLIPLDCNVDVMWMVLQSLLSDQGYGGGGGGGWCVCVCVRVCACVCARHADLKVSCLKVELK